MGGQRITIILISIFCYKISFSEEKYTHILAFIFGNFHISLYIQRSSFKRGRNKAYKKP